MKNHPASLVKEQLKWSLLCAIAWLFFLTPVHGKTKYVDELDRLAAINGQDELFKKLLAFEPFSRLPDPVAHLEVEETLDWLQQKGFWQPGSVRYTYNYAMWLWKAGVKDTSTAMFLFGTIKARFDAARCEDQSSAPSRIRSYENSLGNAAKEFLQNQPQQIREQVFHLSTNQLEARLIKQPPDDWLCGGGMAFFNQYLQKHGNLDGKTVPAPHDSIGKTILVEDASIKPAFVTDDQWLQVRGKAMESAIVSAKKLVFETTSPMK